MELFEPSIRVYGIGNRPQGINHMIQEGIQYHQVCLFFPFSFSPLCSTLSKKRRLTFMHILCFFLSKKSPSTHRPTISFVAFLERPGTLAPGTRTRLLTTLRVRLWRSSERRAFSRNRSVVSPSPHLLSYSIRILICGILNV